VPRIEFFITDASQASGWRSTSRSTARTNFADTSYEELGDDVVGNVLTRRTRAGQMHSFTYDALNPEVMPRYARALARHRDDVACE
jgi:hypothetical protein